MLSGSPSRVVRAHSLRTELPDLVRVGLARRVLADPAVHRFPDEVGMAGVPRVLLDHVDEEAAQTLSVTAERERATASPQSAWSSSGVSSKAERHSQPFSVLQSTAFQGGGRSRPARSREKLMSSM